MIKEIISIFLKKHNIVSKMHTEFSYMLSIAHDMFAQTSALLFDGGDSDAVRDVILPGDKELDNTEQRIRRDVITHLALTGTNELTNMLIFMNVVKDAERIGDYIKNCFALYLNGGILKDSDYKNQLLKIKDETVPLFQKTKDLFQKTKYKKSTALIKEILELENKCDVIINELIKDGDKVPDGVKYALFARYLKRILAHLVNILTSVVMPLDKLDYFDEEAVRAFKFNLTGPTADSDLNIF